MTIYGLAPVKEEGSSIPTGVSGEETFYFERAFTKTEYLRLAIALSASADPLAIELCCEFQQRAITGHERVL